MIFSRSRFGSALMLWYILSKNDGYIRVTLLALGTRQEYYTTLNTEFPLFIWTIHSTVLKLQITHLSAPGCPRVRFLQSLGLAQGRGSCLAPGPGMSRSQWISHHIPPQQFSFRTHDPKRISNMFQMAHFTRIRTYVLTNIQMEKLQLWLMYWQVGFYATPTYDCVQSLFRSFITTFNFKPYLIIVRKLSWTCHQCCHQERYSTDK